MTEYVFRPKRRGKRTRVFYGRYTLLRGDKVRMVSLGTPDVVVARKRLRDIIVKKQKEMEGIISPESQREAASASLGKLAAEYIADIRARRKTKHHADDTEYRIGVILHDTKWTRIADIRPDTFVEWRAKQTLAAKTLREYQAAIVAFLNWLLRLGRISFNPLQSVQKVDTRGQKVHESRAFTLDELRALLDAAPKRRVAYLTLIYTGQRKKEVKALVWGDLHLEGERPHVLFRSETMKDREKRALPLHPSLAAELRAYRSKYATESRPVFKSLPTWDTLMCDLKKAGIAHKDDLGRVLHFHSFRKTFQTLGVLHGINQRAAQEFLGHSDANLTAKIYTDVPKDSYHSEIRKLPWIGSEGEMVAAMGSLRAVPY